MDNQRLVVEFLVGAEVYASPDYPLRPGIHLSSSSVGAGLFFRGLSGRNLKLSTCLYVMLRLRMSAAAPLLPSLLLWMAYAITALLLYLLFAETLRNMVQYQHGRTLMLFTCESRLQICQVAPAAVSCASCPIFLIEVSSEPCILYVGPSVTVLAAGYLRWTYLRVVIDNENGYYRLRGRGSFLKSWLSLISSRSTSPFIEYENCIPLHWDPHKTLPRVSWIPHTVSV